MKGQRFLILRLSAIGDVVRTLPAVKALKRYNPNCYIGWVVEEDSKSLLESQPEIDNVIVFPRRSLERNIKSVKGIGWVLKEIWSFALELRRQEFEVALDFHGILKSGLVSWFSKCPVRVGFDRKASREGSFLFSNIKVSLPSDRLSRIEKNLFLLKGIGIEVKKIDPKLHIPKEDKLYVDSFFKDVVKEIPKPLIAIHPGTSFKTSYKRWMPERYGSLADRLINEVKGSIIFTWGPGELELVKKIQKGMKNYSFLGPRTDSLTQLAEVFSNCDLYIGGDTGPTHVASFMGVPVVVIYGPTDPIINQPFGRHIKVVKKVGCNPCRKRSCQELICLKNIVVEDVFKAAKEILASNI